MAGASASGCFVTGTLVWLLRGRFLCRGYLCFFHFVALLVVFVVQPIREHKVLDIATSKAYALATSPLSSTYDKHHFHFHRQKNEYISLPLYHTHKKHVSRLESIMPMTCERSVVSPLLLSRICQAKTNTRSLLLGNKFLTTSITVSPKTSCIHCVAVQLKLDQKGGSPVEKGKKGRKIVTKKEHHLWKSRDSAQSGQKALNLVRIVSELPNEKEAVYGALDKWTAWETEFPLIAAAKALKILRKRRQWVRVIQVAKWMLSKGQGATMGTYDILLLAFDIEQRVDEAESLWNMIIHAHMRSVSKRLFSRMISLYDHHDMPDKIIEVFADMEELRVKPDEDTVRRVAGAFRKMGREEKRKLVIKQYGLKWKYIHFNGERVRVRRETWEVDNVQPIEMDTSIDVTVDATKS
ncbi:hypothetical protein RJT34_13941 [Clitoria ternatea]|uniref:Pentatricopeptide repeat-containing protein n=1 Tax=Clitoria ternatea TaxID=43366 RepID=A0AAN9JPT9_CLITE